MPATGLVKWLSELKPETVGTAIGSTAFALWLSWDRFSKLRSGKNITAAFEAEKAKEKPLALPTPQTANESDLQAMKAQNALTEARLLETQQAIARVRLAMDAQVRDAAREEGALSAALVSERAENERLTAQVAELTAQGIALVAENRLLRSDPSLPPPPPKRPRRE